MSNYVTMQDVKDLGSMAPEDVDALEALYPGIVVRIATAVSGLFDARLAKRYAAPFIEPFPNALVFNVSRMVAWRLWIRRGFNPSSPIDTLLEKENLDAEAWLKEAADGDKGLVELPARQATPGEATAVNVGGPLGYSEPSPYQWLDVQREAVGNEH